MEEWREIPYNLASALVGVGRIVPDEKILLKSVVLFSFTYGVLRGLLFNYNFTLLKRKSNYARRTDY